MGGIVHPHRSRTVSPHPQKLSNYPLFDMRMYSYFSSTSHFFLAVAFVLGGALALVGCDTIGTSGTSSDDGAQLSVLLTDAPGDIVEAHVTIERVAIVPSEDTTGDAEEGGIEVLSDDTVTVDLVQLQDGVTETLGETTIPEGRYSQIRFVTARDATVYYEDAEGNKQEADLMLPSADETGIKINFDALTIDEALDAVEVTLDFDVEDSFVKSGESGKYIFKPVVKAQSIVVDDDTVATDTN